MEKLYTKHYIINTYDDNDGRIIRKMDMSEVVSNYELITDRIRRALLANEIQQPEKVIRYSFRMLGEYYDQTFHRKEIVEVNLDRLREQMDQFPWEDWGWVQAFQPMVDIDGFTIVELDNEYPSFGPAPADTVDYIQPCYRIYEGGNPDWDVYDRLQRAQQQRRRSTDEPIDVESVEVESKGDSWFTKSIVALKENVPTVLAVVTSLLAIGVMLRTANAAETIVEEAAERGNEILRHIEESIDDAIDMPQVVKVELGDDIEVIGTGRRTW